MNPRNDGVLRWQAQALCAGVDGNAWFPKASGSVALPVLRDCARCPVRTECAAHAVQAGEEYGVWAGLTPGDLLDIRQQVNKGGDLDQLLADALDCPELEEPTRPRPYRPVGRTARGDDDQLSDVA